MVKRAPARRRPRKAKPSTKGLGPAQCRLHELAGTAAEAARAVKKAGGCVVGFYKDPLAGHPILLAILPTSAWLTSSTRPAGSLTRSLLS